MILLLVSSLSLSLVNGFVISNRVRVVTGLSAFWARGVNNGNFSGL
jgi:hypothetical protein